MAKNTAIGPVVLTISLFDKRGLVLIIRSGYGSEAITIPTNAFNPRTCFERVLRKRWPSLGELLEFATLPLHQKSFAVVSGTNLSRQLISMEKRLTIEKHKFGVVYAGPGQTDLEDALKNNAHQVPWRFWRFLMFLSKKISLKGWPDYAGDMDTMGETDGEIAFYTKWCQLEMVFHAAPLIPWDPQDVCVVSIIFFLLGSIHLWLLGE